MLTVAIIIVAVILVLLIPVGVAADYDAEGFRLSARISVADFLIFPRKKKKPKDDLEAKNKKKKSKIRKFKLNFSIEEWFEVAKIAVKALGRFRKSICFDRIKLIYVSANPDPSIAAVRYNAVNAALNSVTPLFEKAFKVRNREVNISTDYDAETSSGEFGATLSVRVGQILYIILLAAFAFGVVFFKSRINKRRERKASRGK